MTDSAAPARVPSPRGPSPARAPRPARSRSRRRFSQVTKALGLPVLLAVAVTAAAPGFVEVRKGDTLSHIAKRHGLTVAELQRINAMGSSTAIFAGQELRVSGGGGGASSSSSAPGNTHRIAPGDTLSGIAKANGVSQSALAAANGISTGATIYAGKTLVIPSGSAASSAGSGSSASAPSSSARRSTGASSASREEVRQIIRDTARQYGVDPSLALAIAHQESGFQQHLVSHADAIGVMQVLPGTAEWMERVVGHDLDPYDLRDNVEAGVAYLKVLRSQASVEDTIAAYYQGLRAVRERGWYEETKPYVANVRALQARYS